MHNRKGLQQQEMSNNKKPRQYHIGLSKINYERLKDLGRAGDSFNDVLNKLLDSKETYQNNVTKR